MAIIATLCHIMRNDALLLQKKSKGLFGEGKWNGVGGKLEPNESPEACVTREVFEETGLKASNIKFHGVLNFYFGDRNELDWVVYIFSTKVFEGEPKAGGEGDLKWFAFKDIPYDEMWQDDEHWLPLLLEDKSFQGNFYFDEEGKELLGFDLKIME
ncbi:MAG: 8-oxo-dGTP diphosphatase [Candidatus Bathyarchaeia archaeon]